MMDRKKALAAIARHVTDADIVLPVYSTAFDWIDLRPHALNYVSHGAMGLASSHALGLALGRPDRRVIRLTVEAFRMSRQDTRRCDRGASDHDPAGRPRPGR